MRLSSRERDHQTLGEDRLPSQIHNGDVFVDPWGIVFRALSDASSVTAAPGHVAVRAYQMTINDKDEIIDQGDEMSVEIPEDKMCRVLDKLTWKENLQSLFRFKT